MELLLETWTLDAHDTLPHRPTLLQSDLGEQPSNLSSAKARIHYIVHYTKSLK